MMVEELNTPKEIGLAFEAVERSIQGIRDQLSQLKWVLGIAAVIIAGCLAGLYNTISNTSVSVAEIKGRLDGIDKRLDTLTTLVSNLQPSKRQGRLEAPQPIPFDYTPPIAAPPSWPACPHLEVIVL